MRVGLDVGGTKIDAVALEDDGSVATRFRLPSGFGPDEVLANAVTAVRAIEERVAAPITSVGVGIPGVVDPWSGRVRHAVNLGLEDLALGPLLEAATQVPVVVENDVNAAALGASRLMGLTGPVAYLNVGTGLAAGIVVDGHLWQGARGVSGEIGHIPSDPVGLDCPCGQRGCLETVASGSAVARRWPTTDEHPARSLFDAADAGDEDARAIRAELAGGIAAAVRLLVLTVDVESVVIGGGVSHLGAPLLDDVLATLVDWSSRSPFLASLQLSSRVCLVPPALPVAAAGAAALVPADARRPSLA